MIITDLKGNSNSSVVLMSENGQNFVRKYGDISRNLERYNNLDLPFPKILRVEEDYYDLEYVRNHNISAYLKLNNTNRLSEFLSTVIDYLSKKSVIKDYSKIYKRRLQEVEFSQFNFTKNDLLDKLPKRLPSSKYFGDLTLENILFDIDKDQFILIDGLTSDYDSYVFDLHKLKQDVLCKWFIRKEKDTFYIDYKLSIIHNYLKQYDHYVDSSLTILMLLRIYPYCKNDFDRMFLIEEINKLWI